MKSKNIPFIFISVIAVVIGFVIVDLSCTHFIENFFFTNEVNKKYESLKLFGLVLAGLIALWNIILANVRLKHSEENISFANKNCEIANKNCENTIQSLDISRKQLSVAQNNAIDQRFKDAIQLLGNEQTATRLGGIYALHHLAIETKGNDKSYTLSVFNILCSYIRQKTNEKEYMEFHCKKNEDGTFDRNNKPSIEIQTIIDLLFKEVNKDYEPCYKGLIANLSYSNLCGANFYNAYCQEANFYEAHCEGTNFHKAHCQKTYFNNARCQNAFFYETHCEGANFYEARCKGTNFSYAHCENVWFHYTSCLNAKFYKTYCEGANFLNTFCEGTDFSYAHCEGTNFKIDYNDKTILENINLQFAFCSDDFFSIFTKFLNEENNYTIDSITEHLKLTPEIIKSKNIQLGTLDKVKKEALIKKLEIIWNMDFKKN